MRDTLTSAVRDAVTFLGYNFYSGNQSDLAGRIHEFPAALLLPTELKSAKGRQERRDLYRVNLLLMSARRSAASDAEPALGIMEAHAIEMCATLRKPPHLFQVSNLKCTPFTKPFTKNMEHGMTVVFDAELFYCI